MAWCGGVELNNAQLINQDSGNIEYYTPIEIIESARYVMGSINLDPFSNHLANAYVKADMFFTRGDNGLQQDWYGNVWMNHPFSRQMNKVCIEKLVSEFELVHINQACCITFAATSEKWFRPLLKYPQCFLHGRTNYRLPDGTIKKGVTKGSVVTYLGDNVSKFKEVFSKLGTVKV